MLNIWAGVIVLGLVSGLLMGMGGIVGSVVMALGLWFLGFNIFETNATTLLIQVLPISIIGLLYYAKQGHLRTRESLLLAVFMFIGVTASSWFAARGYLNEDVLNVLFGAVITICGVYILSSVLMKK